MDQANWPALSGMARSGAVVVLPHSTLQISRVTDVERVVSATQNVNKPHPDDDAIVIAGTLECSALRLAGFAGSLRAFSRQWLAMSEPSGSP